MSELFGDESEDDTLGQEREKQLCKASKFSDVYTDKIQSFVKADVLLPEEMSSSCSNLESLLFYSASNLHGISIVPLGNCLKISVTAIM